MTARAGALRARLLGLFGDKTLTHHIGDHATHLRLGKHLSRASTPAAELSTVLAGDTAASRENAGQLYCG